jgi:homospermidine synthase
VIEPKEEANIKFRKVGLNRTNYLEIMNSIFEDSGKIKFMVNLSVEVETKDLILYCQERKILYIDTAVYPWGDEPLWTLPCWRLCNHSFRRDLLKGIHEFNHKSTAVVSCGANPGMVSWFVKQALINLAKDTEYPL